MVLGKPKCTWKRWGSFYASRRLYFISLQPILSRWYKIYRVHDTPIKQVPLYKISIPHVFSWNVFCCILIRMIPQFCINHRIRIESNGIWTEIIGLELELTIKLRFEVRIKCFGYSEIGIEWQTPCRTYYTTKLYYALYIPRSIFPIVLPELLRFIGRRE